MIKEKFTKSYINDLDKRLFTNYSDVTLSQGYSGDLLILLNHYINYQDTTYLKKINEVTKRIYFILSRKENNLDHNNVGLWTGPFGLYYSLYILDTYLEDTFIEALKEEIKKSCIYIIENDFFGLYKNSYEYSKDMIFGIAGVLTAISYTDLLNEENRDIMNFLYDNIDCLLTDYLYTDLSSNIFAPIYNFINNNHRFINLGYAHGIIGLCTSLEILSNKFNIYLPLYEKCLKICMDLLGYISNQKINIPYFVECDNEGKIYSNGNNIDDNLAWCNGLVGFSLFFNRCIKTNKIDKLNKKIYGFIYNVLNDVYFHHKPNINICHGYSGLFYFYLNNINDKYLKKEVIRYFDNNFFSIPVDNNDFSLLYGRGGALLVYFSYCFNNRFVGDEIFGF